MIDILLVAGLLVSASQAPVATAPQSAGGVTVSGLVTSARTILPLPDVQVVLTPEAQAAGGVSTLEARTDREGRFAFDRVPSGPATLTVSTIGYIFVRRRIEIPVSGNLELAIPLAEGTGTYEESVTVVPAATPAPTGEVRELSSGALQDLRGVAADDPVRAVQALPGVATGDDFQAEFSVRGSAYRHVGLVIDSVATPLLFHAVRGTEDTGSIAMINTDIVGGASLRTGSHPATHGNWLGATLAFDLREGSRDRTAVRAAVSGTNASTVVEGPLTKDGRGSWLVSVRKSYIDWLVRKIDSEIDSTIGFTDTQAKLVFDLTPRQQAQFIVLGGRAVYRKNAANSANDIAKATSTSVLWSAAWRYGADRMLATQRLSVVTNRYRNRGLFFQEQARGDSEAVIWRGDVTVPLGSWSLEGGGHSERQQVATVLRNFQTATATVVRVRAERSSDRGRRVSAAWASIGGRPMGVGVSAGLRGSHDTLADESHVSPWLLVERNVGPVRLTASTSRVVQYSSLEHVAAASADVRPERAWLVDAGAKGAITRTMGWSATLFRRHERDILRRTNQDRLVNGVRVAESIFPMVASTLDGVSRGVDLAVERRAERGPTGWVAYSWAHTQHVDRVTRETFDGDFDQRHTFNAFIQQRLSYRLRVSAKLRYGSNVPIVGYFSGPFDALRLAAVRNQVRMPAYARLDLAGSRTFTFTRSRLTLFVEIMNATNRDNYGPSDGAIRNNLNAIDYAERLIPIVPSAGILLEF